jgi:hypothetical protein
MPGSCSTDIFGNYEPLASDRAAHARRLSSLFEVVITRDMFGRLYQNEPRVCAAPTRRERCAKNARHLMCFSVGGIVDHAVDPGMRDFFAGFEGVANRRHGGISG